MGAYEGRMEESLNTEERRSHPRVIIDLPIEYRDIGDSSLRGATVVNASERGFLIEAVRDIPVGKELNIAVLYPKGFELDNIKVVAKILWKEPYWKDNGEIGGEWEGYQYGLEFIQIFDEDRWKLNLLLSG